MIDRSLFSLPGMKRVCVLLAAFAVLSACLIFIQAWSLSSAITGLWDGSPLEMQLPWIALFLVGFIGIQGVASLQDNLIERYAYSQADRLRDQLLDTIFSHGAEIVQAHGTGNTTTLVLEGIDQVETYIRLVVPKMMRVFLVPLVLVIPVFVFDWISGVIMVTVFPFIILYMVILGRMAQEKAAKQHRKFQVLSNHFIDSLRGLDTLKLFGMSKQHGENIYEVSEEFRGATIKTLRVATLSSLILDLFATLSVAAVAIMLGLRLLDGTLLLFPALTILVVAPEYFKPIREFASDFHASLDGKNALASILSLVKESEAEANSSAPGSTRPISSWNETSHLKSDGIDFAYEETPVLRDVSFEATGFLKVGVVGISGAGKSTLIDLLGGFASPNGGKFVINNESYANLSHSDWQKQLAYLPQDPYIFHTTLRNNIAFYSPHATDEEVHEAVRVVGLQELVAELPEGLNTKIGEGARSLSGGQAQRIALARIFLDGRRSILLFDEPTAHLDIETEFELKQRMLPLMENRLVFFATHRLHWMNEMDLILVMDDTTIVESGTYQELIEADGFFTSFVSQVRGGAA